MKRLLVIVFVLLLVTSCSIFNNEWIDNGGDEFMVTYVSSELTGHYYKLRSVEPKDETLNVEEDKYQIIRIHSQEDKGWKYGDILKLTLVEKQYE